METAWSLLPKGCPATGSKNLVIDWVVYPIEVAELESPIELMMVEEGL